MSIGVFIHSKTRSASSGNISGDDTLKHTESVPEEYASDSFDTADRTLTSVKSPPAPQRSSQYSTPSTLESFRAPAVAAS